MDASLVFANVIQILATGAPKIDCCGKGSHAEVSFARFFNARLAAKLKTLKTKWNLCFIVFCRCYQTPNGSKKTERTKPDGLFSTALLEALAGQFIGFGENDVRPRVIQRGRIRGPGRG